MPQDILLAQINISISRTPLGDAVLKDFFDNIDKVNQAATQFNGFVWRFEGVPDEAKTVQRVFALETDHIVVNMSVWREREDLEKFIFSPPHIDIMKRRGEWFYRNIKPMSAMWWFETDLKAPRWPSLEDGLMRIKMLQAEGNTAFAFGMAKRYSKDDYIKSQKG